MFFRTNLECIFSLVMGVLNFILFRNFIFKHFESSCLKIKNDKNNLQICQTLRLSLRKYVDRHYIKCGIHSSSCSKQYWCENMIVQAPCHLWHSTTSIQRHHPKYRQFFLLFLLQNKKHSCHFQNGVTK